MRPYLIIATVLVAQFTYIASDAPAQAKKRGSPGPALVEIDYVTLKPRATSQSFVGSLEPVRRAVIGSAVEERVEEVLVREGDFVRGGPDQPTTLVELHRQAIEIDLDAAKIELALRAAAIN